MRWTGHLDHQTLDTPMTHLGARTGSLVTCRGVHEGTSAGARRRSAPYVSRGAWRHPKPTERVSSHSAA